MLIPSYEFIDTTPFFRHLAPLAVGLGAGTAWCAVHESRLPSSDVPIYFLEHQALFGGPNIYEGYGGSLHAAAQFGLLSRGAFQLCRYLGFVPDVMHVHDWPTAWISVLLTTCEAAPPFLETASVLTIHNLAHQPRFPPAAIEMMQLPRYVFRPDGLEDHGVVNPLKGGCYHATMLSTVSPRYAEEIRTPPGGAGLHTVMNFRGADLVGILNGIDEAEWDPATDRHLPARYSVEHLDGKAACKAALQRELGLDPDPIAPLIGVVSRMTHQKGTDVIAAAVEPILAAGAQLAVLGSGDPSLARYFHRRSASADGRFAAHIGYDEALAHRIEAGSDLFLMPSRFEPCGLNQMYSQRYGTLPIVHATGGLDDTVEQCDPATGRGTGFKLSNLTVSGLVDTVRWAVDVYRDSPVLFRRMQRRGMNKRMGWGRVAERYAELYEWALDRKHPRPATRKGA